MKSDKSGQTRLENAEESMTKEDGENAREETKARKEQERERVVEQRLGCGGGVWRGGL